MAKLQRLTHLDDGWDGPGSRGVLGKPAKLYQQLIALWSGQFPDDLEPMPTYSGGLRMEWDRGDNSFVAELREHGGMFLCMLDIADDVSYEHESDTADLAMLHEFYLRPDRVS